MDPACFTRLVSVDGRARLALFSAFTLVLTGLFNVAQTTPGAAAPATVDLGETSARMHDVTSDKSVADPTGYANANSCVRYDPPGDGTVDTMSSTATVTAGTYASFAYGRWTSTTQTCPTSYNGTKQSSVGFLPSSTSSVTVGTPFLIGTMRHHNVPVYSSATGTGTSDNKGGHLIFGELEVSLAGTIDSSFPMTVDETTNICRSTFDADGHYDPTGAGTYAFDQNGAVGPRATYAFGWSTNYHYAYDRSGTLRSLAPYDTAVEGATGGAIYGNDGRSCEDDTLTMTAISSDTTWTDAAGVSYKLVLRGFVNNGPDDTCTVMDAATAESRLETTFYTQEGGDTYGCLYGSLEQVRPVTFAKDVSGSQAAQRSVSIPQFTYTNASSSSSAGAAWGALGSLQPTGWGAANAATDPRSYELLAPGEGAVITEDQQGPAPTEDTAGWKLSGVTCLQGDGTPVLDEDGNRLDTSSAVDLSTGTLDLGRVGLAESSAAAPITCTWHNAYSEPGPDLRVEKTFTGSDATSGTPTVNADYTITVTNDGGTEADTGVLTDRPGFATGLTVNTVWASQSQDQIGQDSSVVADQGDGSYRITDGTTVPGGGLVTFYVRVNATLDPSISGYDADALACSDSGAGYESGHGLFNEVSTEDDKDSDGQENNTACGSLDPGIARAQVSIHKTGIGGTLSGATFEIYASDPSSAGATPLDEAVTVDSDDGSVFTTSALDMNHDYWLVETVAPVGHERLSDPVGFHLGADGISLLDPDVDAGAVTVSTTGTVPDTITVHDTAVAVTLPLSGGSGRLAFVLGAAALAATSGGLALRQRKARRMATE